MISSRAGKACLLLLAASFFLLRFVHLTADYPRTIRWDDGIATDEGWYASSAINAHAWGQGSLQGDMNIPVLMPVWPAIARLAFAVGGFGIVSLRATAVLFYLLDVLLVCGLLRRYGARHWIPLYVALAAVNPWSFVFSRSAFLEFPMLAFVLIAVSAASFLRNWTKKPNYKSAAIILTCIASFTIALLLKTTAITLFPAVLYIVFFQARFDWYLGLRRSAAIACGVALLYFLYWLLFIHPRIQDVQFYLSVVQNTLRLTPRGFLADASRPFRYGMGSDHLLFPLTLILIPASVCRPRLRALWRDPLYALPAVWIISFLTFMVKHNNDPARYFAVILPALLLVAVALLRNSSIFHERLSATLRKLVQCGLAINLIQTSLILLHPAYTFSEASHAIDRLVLADTGASNIVIGNNAHEVAVQSNIRPVNLLFHSQDIAGQMQQHRPDWWLQFSPIEDGHCYKQVLSSAYTAEWRGEWRIFYPGQRLILWRLHPIPGRALPHPLTTEQIKACSPPIYK